MSVSIAVGNKRLLKLAAFLRTVPRRRFDYSTWIGEDWKGAQDLSCGTTACAMGWAATMPEFRRLGLRLDEGVPSLDGNGDGFDAAQELFGLELSESIDLFAPDDGEANATPKQVAKKIEQFVKARAAA